MTTTDRDLNRALMRLWRKGGWAGQASLALPVLGGGLLLAQTWLLASTLHQAIVEGVPLAGLLAPVASILLLIAVRAGLSMAGEMLAIEASESIKLGLRRDLFAEMLARQPLWTGTRSSGALSTLVIEQVEALDGFFTRYLPATIQAAILPIAFSVVILPFDWTVALIFLVTAPLIPVFMMLAGWVAEAASKAQASALARLTGRFADRLRGIVTLKLFGREAAETEAMYAASEELRRRSMKVMRIAFLSSAALEFFAALGVAGVALYCGLTLLGLVHLRPTPLTLETALFCLLMAPEVYQPLRLLAVHYHDRAAAKAALREVAATMGSPAGGEAAAPVHVRLPAALPARGPIRVEARALALTSPRGDTILAGADLTVKAGEHIAITGPSGAGKTTLLDAIARLRDADGDILLAGTLLGDVPDRVLRSRVAYAGQRARLLAGTIADNIRLAGPGAEDAAVQAAAERALVTGFAAALPLGLDTPVGENGLGLSGGEAQRVALARLYLRDPGLLLLDEPTAHLDPATEDAVLEQLLAFAQDRTLIIATHAAAVATRMDRAYRLADGQLIELERPRPARVSRTRGDA